MAQSLQSLHTFALNNQCQHFVEIKNLEQLENQSFLSPFCLLGEGSNTVFLDDFNGTVIKMATQGIDITETQSDYLIKVAAGENWHQLVCYLLEKNIAGLENLALIPGTVGAAPVQNIGAYGVEIARFITCVEYFDIATKTQHRLTNQQCLFGYRDSIFKHQLKNEVVITQVHLALPKAWQAIIDYGPLQQLGNKASPRAIFEQVILTRQAKLPNPYILANAGSFFKNPIISHAQLEQLLMRYSDLVHYNYGDTHYKVAAGWLIDDAGLKGHAIAGIEVHQEQALVLVNKGQSQGKDLIAMINHIQTVIMQRYGIALEHEVRLIDSVGECHIDAAGGVL